MTRNASGKLPREVAWILSEDNPLTGIRDQTADTFYRRWKLGKSPESVRAGHL
jgi:hypothetical protein